MPAPLHYDPFAEEVIQDPHPIYARLREEAPCYHVEKWDCYALSRFEDIWTASMDAENYSAAAGHHRLAPADEGPAGDADDQPDGPAGRTRSCARRSRKFFTPGVVRRHEAQIQGFVDDAFADVADRTEADLFNDFAAKVSVKRRMPRERLPARGRRAC